MRSIFRLSLLAGLVLMPITSAMAEGEVNCEAGQKKTAFSDGNTVTEVCVDASEMDATVDNPEVPVGEDPSNTDGHVES